MEKLFVLGQPVAPAEREQLLRLWHRRKLARLAAAAAAWLIADGRRRMARQ